jgi:UDP-galactopyranose mutase
MSQTTEFPFDLICLSHLRWDFVFQRPQHLLSRAAASHERVFFFEEPIFGKNSTSKLDVRKSAEGVLVAQPHLPEGMPHNESVQVQRQLLDELLSEWNVRDYILWYYTPMALSFSRHLDPALTIYDCMDELSLFKNAPKELLDNEGELLQIADLVFTGGQSLYEAKKDRNPNVFAFPSSIDFAHFAQARKISKHDHSDPEDQAPIPHSRMGYCGVIDERIDFDLVSKAANARPDWQFIFIGPVVKIDPASLPKHPNIHYLGQKDYKDLPQYLAGWDVAMMPFAINDSTKFISPTKTPEYLAAGRPVVSTAIRDVVRPYGEQGLVEIAGTLDEFIRAAAQCGMDEGALPIDWLKRVDTFLGQTSWQKTWDEMSKRMADALEEKSVTSSEMAMETDFLSDSNAAERALSPEVA